MMLEIYNCICFSCSKMRDCWLLKHWFMVYCVHDQCHCVLQMYCDWADYELFTWGICFRSWSNYCYPTWHFFYSFFPLPAL